MNKLRNIAIIVFVALCIGSCKEDFLKEEDTTKRDTDFLNTPEGLKTYAAGLPAALHIQSAHESCIAHFQIGTDEFSTGGDDSQECWNSYNDRLTAYIAARPGLNDVDAGVLWDDTYIYLAAENLVIDKAPIVLADDPALNSILGAAHFMRAWNHFNLIQQWGDVPMMDRFIESFTREFPKTQKQVILQFVIDDFQQAYNLLENPAARVTGKIYRDAAAHFLAKALLYRQSEINADFNASTKSEDLAKALAMCDEVISHRTLATNYADMHNFKKDNDPDVEGLSEIILSASHGVQQISGDPQNYVAMFYISLYQNWSGMVRDIGGGREYQRLRTTDYSMDVFDRVNDSRFWKSFRTTQNMNNAGKRSGQLDPTLTPPNRTRQANGQVSVMHIINKADDYARFESTVDKDGYHFPGGQAGRYPLLMRMDNGGGVWDTIRCPRTNNVVPNVIVRYRTVAGDAYPAGTPPEGRYYGYQTSFTSTAAPSAGCTFPSLSKYMDGTRPAVGSNGLGTRDFVSARLGETYLIAAEVKVRQGDYPGALNYINEIRKRAAYKEDEDRSKYVDGAQAFHLVRPNDTPISSYSALNTYYISNNIPVTTAATNLIITGINSLPAEDEAVIAKLKITGDFDRMMCLVLNERTRELCGELQRWHDLARTKTLLQRTLAYNQDAIYEKDKSGNGLREHHYLRPIPQRYLDAIWLDGKPLTPQQKKEMQNPGY